MQQQAEKDRTECMEENEGMGNTAETNQTNKTGWKQIWHRTRDYQNKTGNMRHTLRHGLIEHREQREQETRVGNRWLNMETELHMHDTHDRQRREAQKGIGQKESQQYQMRT